MFSDILYSDFLSVQMNSFKHKEQWKQCNVTGTEWNCDAGKQLLLLCEELNIFRLFQFNIRDNAAYSESSFGAEGLSY